MSKKSVMPNLTNVALSDYFINSPGFGGLNIADLEYDILDSQSPDMLNLMVSNGTLCKRYGQTTINMSGDSTDVSILAIGRIANTFYLQTERSIFKTNIKNNAATLTKIIDLDSYKDTQGRFFQFNNQLLFMNGHQYLVFDDFGLVTDEPYIPDIAINMKPDGSYADLVEDYNRLTGKFKNTFDGDGTTKTYQLITKNLKGSSSDPLVEVIVGTVKWTYGGSSKGFTVDWTNGTITFTEAPAKGTNNVVITACSKTYDYKIFTCKYMAAYGGNNNSRLFVAGNGTSEVYFSEVLDASYFPESQYFTIGNKTEDVTGFGEQYSTLVVFKPSCVFGIDYVFDEDNLAAQFNSYTINSLIGCDCKHTIATVNNQLTWLNSIYGVCTLVSTTIKDEKNVVYISRNINSGMKKGLLDYDYIKNNVAFNYDGKYWVCEASGTAYVWDYNLTPFTYSGNIDSDALRLAWFKFDNIYVNDAVVFNKNLYYVNDKVITFNRELFDNLNGQPSAINSYYKTKLFDFGDIDYLKTVRNMYVSVRGDTPSKIKIKYITEDIPNGIDAESDISIYNSIWSEFNWKTFGWQVVNFKKVFNKVVNLRKLELFGVYFSNEQMYADMCISNVKIKYHLAQKVR